MPEADSLEAPRLDPCALRGEERGVRWGGGVQKKVHTVKLSGLPERILPTPYIPCLSNGNKQAIGVIEASRLQLYVTRRVRLRGTSNVTEGRARTHGALTGSGTNVPAAE